MTERMFFLMAIAILTGASSGLGREFALRIHEYFPEIEQIWLIARRAQRLEELCTRLDTARALSADLTKEEGFERLSSLLKQENPDVALLINCAGCGYLGAFDSSHSDEQEAMVRLNALSLTSVTRIVLPYMHSGARIINISSIASFVPNANMAVYSATKAYVQFFSRALRYELRARSIGVTAVCPGPMATEFLSVGRIEGNSRTFSILPYCSAPQVAKGALRAARANRAVYTPRIFYKFYHVLAHILPKSLLIPAAKT